MACRYWSLQTGSYFTGLCGIEMLPETENETQSCSLCLSPVEPDAIIDDYVPPDDGLPVLEEEGEAPP